MIIRTNGNRNSPLNRRIDEKCQALIPHRADDNVDFRRACVEGELALIPIAFDMISESPKVELTEIKGLVADAARLIHDDSIVDLVHQALRATGYGQLRSLQVDCVNGRVELRGRLPTYYLNQIAQSVTRSVAGVREIDNQVDVVSPR